MKSLVLIILMSLGFSVASYAQSNVIQGVVHAFDSIPLIGAEVIVNSTKQSYFTNSAGQFMVECNPNDQLKIKAEGFYSQNVKISGNVRIVAVNLKLKSATAQRKYNIGYGNVSERDNSGAITSVNYKDIDFTKYVNIYDVIRDNFAGVQVVNNEIVIRGTNSLLSSNEALIIVDGIITDGEMLNSISPIEVKSIDIIKDAGSAAVYGSRGSNGVVIIELLKGGEL